LLCPTLVSVNKCCSKTTIRNRSLFISIVCKHLRLFINDTTFLEKDCFHSFSCALPLSKVACALNAYFSPTLRTNIQVVATWLGIGHTFGLHPDMSAIDVSLNWQPGSRANGIFHDLTCCGKADDVAVVTMLREPLARAISEYSNDLSFLQSEGVCTLAFL
jgi:hypothetical protein